MTYNEIFEIIKNNGVSVSDFAYKSCLADSKNFVPSDNVNKLKIAKETLRNLFDSYDKENPICKAYDLIPSTHSIIEKEYLESIGIGEIQEVEQHGGEDEGSNWYSIKYFPKHDVYMKVSGWYQSHYGTDFEDWNNACSEVKPNQQVITIYA